MTRPYSALARASTPASERAIRRAVALGPQGIRLGLDAVHGVVRVEIHDHGAPGVQMPAGHAHAVVAGGDPAAVFAAVLGAAPADVRLTVRWRPATWWDRMREWARWRLWRLLADPRRSGGRAPVFRRRGAGRRPSAGGGQP